MAGACDLPQLLPDHLACRKIRFNGSLERHCVSRVVMHSPKQHFLSSHLLTDLPLLLRLPQLPSRVLPAGSWLPRGLAWAACWGPAWAQALGPRISLWVAVGELACLLISRLAGAVVEVLFPSAPTQAPCPNPSASSAPRWPLSPPLP